MIEIKELQKEYRGSKKTLTAIDNISLSINKGEFVSIIGPSGCGKTTFLKLIGGLLKQTKGTISIHKKFMDKEVMKKMSIVFQNPVLLPWRTVQQNVKLPIELNNEKNNIDKIHEVLELVELKDFKNCYPNELSGGMQQRVAIARALIFNPEFLLMDEPFGALDEINRNKLNLELLRIWRGLSLTVLFVTHSITEAIFLSDRVIILSNRPAKIKTIINIDIPRPRRQAVKESSQFQEYVKCIREKLE
ncbi:MAG: ABC transporter ATP-binding protein [Nanoarchaeota archaeon]|nr:ABC transporter ATP-binding protein [Nanoarchaeota archaeon]